MNLLLGRNVIQTKVLFTYTQVHSKLKRKDNMWLKDEIQRRMFKTNTHTKKLLRCQQLLDKIGQWYHAKKKKNKVKKISLNSFIRLFHTTNYGILSLIPY